MAFDHLVEVTLAVMKYEHKLSAGQLRGLLPPEESVYILYFELWHNQQKAGLEETVYGQRQFVEDKIVGTNSSNVIGAFSSAVHYISVI